MMIYEGIKEIETEGSEHVAISISPNNLIQTIANILTDISGEKLTAKRTSAMLYKTLMFNKGTPVIESIDELENNTSLVRKVKGMLKEAEPFYFIYGSYVIKDINDFITTVTVQYYLVSVLRDGNNGNNFTIKITKIKHYKAEEGRKGYGKILMQ
jgi:hypothetical protein